MVTLMFSLKETFSTLVLRHLPKKHGILSLFVLIAMIEKNEHGFRHLLLCFSISSVYMSITCLAVSGSWQILVLLGPNGLLHPYAAIDFLTTFSLAHASLLYVWSETHAAPSFPSTLKRSCLTSTLYQWSLLVPLNPLKNLMLLTFQV